MQPQKRAPKNEPQIGKYIEGNDSNIIACIFLYCLAKLNLHSRFNLVILPLQATGNTLELVLIEESIWAYMPAVTSKEKAQEGYANDSR